MNHSSRVRNDPAVLFNDMDVPIIKLDDAHKRLLDRDGAMTMAANFQDAIDLVNELINYGTNLVVRAFASSDRGLKAICVLFVQLRQFLTHLDGISMLLAAGNCGTADLQLRSLLEGAHLMEWTLAKDTEAKIQYLYVGNLRRRREWDKSVISGTPEFAKHFDVTAGLQIAPEDLKEVTAEGAKIDELLGKPPFEAINAKFTPHYTQRGFDEPWYKVYGAASIRSIGDELGRLKEYTYIYSVLSGVTHGSDIWKNVFFGAGKIEISPLREPQHIPRVVQLAATLAIRIYRLILCEFRSGEEQNFDRKYIHEWRERFLRKYEIELTPQIMIV
jgi:hypothetical protein